MKIGVLLKQVPDTESKIRIRGDGAGIEEGDIKWIISPYDEFAVEEAIRLKEKVGDAEVVVVTLGPARAGDPFRTALAMGADRAVTLDDAAFAGLDALGVGKALAAVCAKEGFDLVFAGRQAIDGDSNAVAQIVAAVLDWPSVTWINAFEYEGATALVKRPVGGGSNEVVRVRLPAVFTCTKGLNEPRYASLPGIMKAKKKPVDRYAPSDLGLDDLEPVVQIADFTPPATRPAGRILSGDLSAQVSELVRLLRDEAKVL